MKHFTTRLKMTPELFSRNMTRTTADGQKTPVSIRFGTPTREPLSPKNPNPAYYCPIQLIGFDDETLYPIFGIDALQALTLALSFAGTLLGVCPYVHEINDWNEESNYGFPVLPVAAKSAAGGKSENKMRKTSTASAFPDKNKPAPYVPYIQNVLATRILERTHPDGTTSAVEVKIGDLKHIPSDSPDSSDYWECWTDVNGAESFGTHCRVNGSDSMQAISLAMSLAGITLSDSDVADELQDYSLPNFGFPPLHLEPEGSTVSGAVQLELCNDPAQNITFAFRDYDGGPPTVIQQVLTPVSADTGTFAIPGVPDGTYDIAVTGYCWLRKIIPGLVVNGADVSGLSVFLPGGDFNNDNIVDAAGFSAAIGDYGAEGEP